MKTSAGKPVDAAPSTADRQGNRDPTPGHSPGYSEQQPSTAAAARQPGGRRGPHNEEGGVGRDVAAEPNAESAAPATSRRAGDGTKPRKRGG